MSSGHREPEAPPPGTVVRFIQHPNQQGLRYFLSQRRPVSRKYLVPYGAGSAMDGGMTYVDEGVPEQFKMGVNVDKYVGGHEGFEWWLMTRRNMPYWVGAGARSAHWWATGYEHLLLRLDGWHDDEIEAYEKEWLTYVSEDEAQRISPETVPPDLFTGAYEAAEDSDIAEDEGDKKILPILLEARSRIVAVRETNQMQENVQDDYGVGGKINSNGGRDFNVRDYLGRINSNERIGPNNLNVRDYVGRINSGQSIGPGNLNVRDLIGK